MSAPRKGRKESKQPKTYLEEKVSGDGVKEELMVSKAFQLRPNNVVTIVSSKCGVKRAFCGNIQWN